jgi:hypothetical protein
MVGERVMKSLFFFQAILSFGIFSFILMRMFKIKDKSSHRVMKDFLILGIAYLAVAISSFLWFFDLLPYSLTDFLVVFSFLILIQNIVFFRSVYLFSRNRKLYYFLMLYLFAIPFLVLILNVLSVLFLVLSYLFSLLLFIDFAIRDDVYRKVGYFGIFYSVVSLILILLLFFNINNLFLYSIFSGTLLFILIYYFIYDLEKFSILPFQVRIGGKSYFVKLLSHLIFIVTIVNFIFIGTIGVHEFGHFSVSQFYGCEYGKIVYDGDLFHTEALCTDKGAILPVSLGGILLPILIAILFFVVGGQFLREIGIIMIGFNLLSVSKDLLELEISQNFVFISTFFGVIFLVYGVFVLARSKIDTEIYENFSPEVFSKIGGDSPSNAWRHIVESEQLVEEYLDKKRKLLKRSSKNSYLGGEK